MISVNGTLDVPQLFVSQHYGIDANRTGPFIISYKPITIMLLQSVLYWLLGLIINQTLHLSDHHIY